MGNTLLTFRDQYFEYGGDRKIEDRGLTIGGYESAWLADLVASYFFENPCNLFTKTTKYYGIYSDDRIVFFDWKWSTDDITRWLKTFQVRVDDLCGSKGLNFTAEIWNPNKNSEPIVKKVAERIKYDQREILPFSRYCNVLEFTRKTQISSLYETKPEAKIPEPWEQSHYFLF